MKYTDSDQLANVIERVAEESSLANKFNSVDVEAGEFNDEGEFIRVLIHVKNLKDLTDEEVDTITSSIEREVSSRDDRFPSVRFSES